MRRSSFAVLSVSVLSAFALAAACGKTSSGDSATPSPSPTNTGTAATCPAFCTQSGNAGCSSGTLGGYGGPVALCSDYCTTNAAWPAGTVGAATGNTIACRAHFADLIVAGTMTASSGCAIVGPSGGNTCGSWCENYCQLTQKNCSG